ncbi:MAG: MmgE/PrpD family protein [Candidatus Aminicenantes bacterium]|nr:MmgE/PrpD family protein [Candidatus Aminicenantes bacterium]
MDRVECGIKEVNHNPIIFKLARSIYNFHNINLPEKTEHQAKRVLLDTLGVGIYGASVPLYKIAVQASLKEYAAGECLVWGRKEALCASGAVFFNTLAASATDFDEGHRTAVGHPASVVVPTALAAGRESNQSINKILSAIAVGYEIGVRFSSARDISKIETYSTGRWGALASAACAAVLLKLSESQIGHALSLAALLSPAMMGGHIDVSCGSMAKEGAAWAAQAGVKAAYLAKQGFIGPYAFLEKGNTYETEILFSELGETWNINRNYFKPYACCRWIHPAIDAALELKRKYEFSFDQIKAVEIDTFSRIIDMTRTRKPVNSSQAQFNLPFCLAGALFFDELMPWHTSGEALQNKRILNLASSITLRAKKEFDKVFPEHIPCRVTIKTSENSYSSRIINSPKWGDDNPAADIELFEKFNKLAGDRSRLIWEAIMQDKLEKAKELESLILE